MTRQREGPPDGTRRTLKLCASVDTQFNNTDEDNSLNGHFQAPRTAVEIVANLRFQRNVERVHGLGARVTAELLAELGSERSIQNIIDEKVARYAAIDPVALAAVGGDKFGPLPLHVVPR